MNFNIPSASLKGIFFIHFLLSVWSLQSEAWLPQSYMYYNMIFIISLLWCIQHKEAEEPLFLAIGINVISILLDVITIAVYYDKIKDHTSDMKFSVAMCIINLLMRPATSVMLLKQYNETMGRYNNLGFPGFGIGRGPYEDIDQPATQSVPKTTVDTGSPLHDHHLSDSHIPPYPPNQ